MIKPVRKAVFPVAGLGTRLLPATKTMPKEMLTVVDRPLIQYAVDEAREAGIEQLIFVTGRGKSSLVDYFDMSFELEATMTRAGKSLESLASSRTDFGEIVSVRQQQPLGLGHAVWCARHIVGDEPFAVLLPDDLMVGKPGALRQMIDAYQSIGGNIVCAADVPADKTASYGIVTPGASSGNCTEVSGLVEKPQAGRCALHAWRDRTLYPAARGDARPRRPGAGRRRGNPVDRRHGQADRDSGRSTR